MLRGWWDGSPRPLLELPLGDLCGMGFGNGNPNVPAGVEGIPPNTRRRGLLRLYCRLPMPFGRAARMTLTNESPWPVFGSFGSTGVSAGAGVLGTGVSSSSGTSVSVAAGVLLGVYVGTGGVSRPGVLVGMGVSDGTGVLVGAGVSVGVSVGGTSVGVSDGTSVGVSDGLASGHNTSKSPRPLALP